MFGTREALAVSRVQECTSQSLLTRRSYRWHTALSTLLCVLIVTKESAVDLGSGLRCRQPTVPYLWPVTYAFHSKLQVAEEKLCFVRVRSYIFFVVLCVIRAVHKFDFKLVTNETPNKWRPVGKMSCSARVLCFWQDLCVFPRPSSRMIRDSTHAVQVNRILLSKEH